MLRIHIKNIIYSLIIHPNPSTSKSVDLLSFIGDIL